ncbi:MarR family transcriptional regulator [Halobiforma lacisalsi AJ5]|uniref:MarR family transcriptional regulator n=1 Tax=Natronobacterium lacisalsi AJ5 TaxID=358396 RepID=M0LKB0_NATLA|nr:MarR family transcriptional regulator [Halobiforma lacisalsi]APW97209.1 MarR family transcriptional regulator [Halobiforma lacisalsi AJ5]EMA34042.1 hypothetical protein C445_08492 [Halobiforma lacisalsi AJ5]
MVAAVVAGILLLGAGAAWQTYRQAQAHAGMMGGHGGTMHGVHPVWYLLGAVLAGGIVAGAYALGREQLVGGTEPEAEAGPPTAGSERDDSPAAGGHGSGDGGTGSSDGQRAEATSSATAVLEVLPEDERRVLGPVVDSPGLTQIELRDRADFSKSKVSQTVTDLEKRGLLYREKQGRTYRVYPSDDLEGDG